MHPKKHIPLIPLVLKSKGVSNVVISPGSRNAPLIEAFYQEFKTDCVSIVDERSAAYFALGLASFLRKPVVIITTSGTAVLNLAPALAEAFYLGIPLIAVTADRPPEWIDQEDNQTIRQPNVFSNIKASYNLPVQMNSDEDYWFAERILNDAGDTCSLAKPGPVHINVPIREPLYEKLPKVGSFRKIDIFENNEYILPEHLRESFFQAEKIIIITGQLHKSDRINKAVQDILSDQRICIFSQFISNLQEASGIINGDMTLSSCDNLEEKLLPDLVIYVGGQVVSKQVKRFFSSLQCNQWLVNPEGKIIDTFKSLNTVIQSKTLQFFEAVSQLIKKETPSDYQQFWIESYNRAQRKLLKLIEKVQYSDLGALYILSKMFSSGDILFAGNSSIIRYLQLFPIKASEVFANRGTSGIDGCLSTAAGIAHATEKTVYAILGDLSFLYDSNGLWNNRLPSNLKIIVINNSGGGIFSLIDGPQKFASFDQFLKTPQQVDISKLCEAFHTKYYSCSTMQNLERIFFAFKKEAGVSLLEIKTPEEDSPRIFSNFIKQLKS
jgi:2-succinyl-5-enolpyruvyl-6-hydroxy-3-cyclohexene-1-carboxylate synthase